jgi:hypothetical protein
MDLEKLDKLKAELEEMELIEPKPGYQTTEFWLTVAAQAIAILVLFGLPTAEEQAVNGWLIEAVEAAGAFLVIIATGWKYIEGRAKVKVG